MGVHESWHEKDLTAAAADVKMEGPHGMEYELSSGSSEQSN